MKLIISGGREFSNYDFFKEQMYYFLRTKEPIEFMINGMCDVPGILTHTTTSGKKIYGVDGLAARWAEENMYKTVECYADWKKWGGRAGPIRNELMGSIGTHYLSFWDGKSRGTANMIKWAKYFKLIGEVVRY